MFIIFFLSEGTTFTISPKSTVLCQEPLNTILSDFSLLLLIQFNLCNNHETFLLIFQIVVQLTIVYQYIIHFLLAYYIETPSVYLDTTFCDLVFFADTFVSILHAFWILVRLHVRVYRRSLLLILYDVISLFPFVLICKYIICSFKISNVF